MDSRKIQILEEVGLNGIFTLYCVYIETNFKICYFHFLLINQNLGASVYAPKSGYQSQKQPVLKPYISQISPCSVLFCKPCRCFTANMSNLTDFTIPLMLLTAFIHAK